MNDNPIIYAYTRKQAVEDGEQVDVSTTAAEAGNHDIRRRNRVDSQSPQR